MDSHLTIARLVDQIAPNDTDTAYELILIASTNDKEIHNGIGVKMNPHRTLRSYRLKEKDILLFRKEVTDNEIWRTVAGNQELAVMMKIPEPHNVSKTMKVSCQIKIKELKAQFLKKAFLHVPPCTYGVFANFSEFKEEELIEDHLPLSTINLPLPMRLNCKLLFRTPQKCFGTNPYHLEVMNDDGLEVPRTLVILKELLEINNGFATEGIFRRAGSESTMKTIKTALEEGKEIQTRDVHSVATLIKRWFKELPARLLVHPSVELPVLVNDKNQKIRIQELLPSLYSHLLSWLFSICLKVMDNYAESKMDAKNLCKYSSLFLFIYLSKCK